MDSHENLIETTTELHSALSQGFCSKLYLLKRIILDSQPCGSLNLIKQRSGVAYTEANCNIGGHQRTFQAFDPKNRHIASAVGGYARLS